jgi:hypothetical protein
VVLSCDNLPTENQTMLRNNSPAVARLNSIRLYLRRYIRGKSWQYFAFTLFAVILAGAWLAIFIQTVSTVDFYPLYFGARKLLAGQSPYGQNATDHLLEVWDAPFADAGIAYPVPLLVLTSLKLGKTDHTKLILLALFMPLYDAARHKYLAHFPVGLIGQPAGAGSIGHSLRGLTQP